MIEPASPIVPGHDDGGVRPVGLLPIAFTIEATQEGPPVVGGDPAWSEFVPVGMTQLTCGELAVADIGENWRWSLRGMYSTYWLTHSEPTHAVALGGVALGPHMCWMALGPVHRAIRQKVCSSAN